MIIRGKKMSDEEIEVHRNWFLRLLTNRIVYALHLFTYVMVNGLLIMIWLVSWTVTGLNFFWPFHPIFGWGFGVGFHALTYVMYNDKSEYLTYIRQQSNYIMTFIYHAFFYISINLYLFLLNLIDLTFIWFTWTLGMWGIFFVFHAIGFFTWNKIFDNQWKKLRPKYQEYPKNKLKSKIKYKIGHFWLVLLHLTYFIVTFIIVNIFVFIGTGLGQVERLLIVEIFVSWGLYLSLHAFGYILFYHIEFIKFDCRLQALVPLSDSSHAAIRGKPKYWEANFEKAMNKWLNGEWYIPEWWGVKSKREFRDHLIRLGFTER